MKLDLACGQRKQEGFLGVDSSPECNPDFLVNLTEFPWPFEDNSVEGACSLHFLEHLDGDQQIKFMEELYRILQPQGEAVIVVPRWDTERAWKDPTHKRPVPKEAFNYYNAEWRQKNNLGHYNIRCDFDWALVREDHNTIVALRKR
jgi:predicted SAM-dependent methyltransferase